MELTLHPDEHAVCRLTSPDALPQLAPVDGLVSVTTTPGEVSLVCPIGLVPPDATAEPGWRLLTVAGPLEFDLVGILAELSTALAEAGVSLFAVSTYDTDHLLVKDVDLARAIVALTSRGHEITDPPPSPLR
jgi:hypothetical protein